jgi:hypothetical protein
LPTRAPGLLISSTQLNYHGHFLFTSCTCVWIINWSPDAMPLSRVPACIYAEGCKCGFPLCKYVPVLRVPSVRYDCCMIFVRLWFCAGLVRVVCRGVVCAGGLRHLLKILLSTNQVPGTWLPGTDKG